MNNRRLFLKKACKPIVFAACGIPLIVACSNEDDASSDITNSENTSTPTKTEPLIIDITSNTFKDLQNVGGWLNYTKKNILLVRIDESEIRVFNNSCPHQGNRDKWSYDGSTFECGYHNNTYSDTCTGSLTCYKSNLEGNTLKIDF